MAISLNPNDVPAPGVTRYTATPVEAYTAYVEPSNRPAREHTAKPDVSTSIDVRRAQVTELGVAGAPAAGVPVNRRSCTVAGLLSAATHNRVAFSKWNVRMESPANAAVELSG